MKIWRELLLRLLASYLAVGLIYALAGYASRAIQGKAEVFSPVISIPVDTLFWIGNAKATLLHFGWTAQVVITLAGCLIALVFLLTWLLHPQAQARTV